MAPWNSAQRATPTNTASARVSLSPTVRAVVEHRLELSMALDHGLPALFAQERTRILRHALCLHRDPVGRERAGEAAVEERHQLPHPFTLAAAGGEADAARVVAVLDPACDRQGLGQHTA